MKSIMKLFAAFVVALAGFANAAGFDSAGVVDHTGNWWNPAQNMMGVAIHQQGGLIQAEWFIYDAVNKPTWLSFGGKLKHDSATGNDTLSSPLYRTHGPQPMGYNATQAGVDQPFAGSMSITFTDACHASMHYQYTDPSGGLPQQETLTLTPLLFGDAACTTPEKVKVTNPQPVPTGCIDASMQCWKEAVVGGTVKFIGTSAKMVGLTGADSALANRPIMFAYFINGGPVSATSGPYSLNAFYADTGEPLFANGVSQGFGTPVDWVVGNDKGVLFHATDGTCWQWQWYPPTSTSGNRSVWSVGPASCS